MNPSQGMSDDLKDTSMRAFDLALIRESYLGGINRQLSAQRGSWEEEPLFIDDFSISSYPDPACPCQNISMDSTPNSTCTCTNEDCPCKYHLLTTYEEEEGCPCGKIHLDTPPSNYEDDDRYHIISGGAEDCPYEKIHIYTASSDFSSSDTLSVQNSSSSPIIRKRTRKLSRSSSFYDYNPLAHLSLDRLLEHNLIFFDFLLHHLLPDDSPDYPARILEHLEPGCPDCRYGQAHPLPKFEQYRHSMHDLVSLLDARQREWAELGDEIGGHEDWGVAFHTGVGIRELHSKFWEIAWGGEVAGAPTPWKRGWA
ncbi:MAG: hypothetical protein Q9221_007006 [Calogaya cf. arnoldii]